MVEQLILNFLLYLKCIIRHHDELSPVLFGILNASVIRTH